MFDWCPPARHYRSWLAIRPSGSSEAHYDVSETPKFQSTKGSFLLSVGVNHPPRLCVCSSRCVCAGSGDIMYSLSGFDNICLRRRWLVIYNTHVGQVFIQSPARESEQINRGARWTPASGSSLIFFTWTAFTPACSLPEMSTNNVSVSSTCKTEI